MSDILYFVQFPHPGMEHRPDRDGWKDWNHRAHSRKFMKSAGRWRTGVDAHAVEHDGDVVFWGEWEPPSEVIAEYTPPDTTWPRYLQLPFWHTSSWVISRSAATALTASIVLMELVGPGRNVRDRGAAWCAVAGADFLSGLAEAPSRLDVATREGWIWVRRLVS